MLKIVSGRIKGRKLKTQKGCQTRPTLEKTRDSLFNVITSRYRLEEYEAYDLFSGSGALGFEAYSRGASKVFFFENDHQSYHLINENISALSLKSSCVSYNINSIRWLEKQKWQSGYKLFLIDPPYNSQFAQEVIRILASNTISLTSCLVIIETDKNVTFDTPEFFQLFQQKLFGKTRLDFFEIKKKSTV